MMLLKVWIAYAIWGVLVYSAIFVWAVRNRQFTELDRQRYIALNDEESGNEDQSITSKPGVIDRFTWLGLLVITCAMVAAVLVTGLKNG